MKVATLRTLVSYCSQRWQSRAALLGSLYRYCIVVLMYLSCARILCVSLSGIMHLNLILRNSLQITSALHPFFSGYTWA